MTEGQIHSTSPDAQLPAHISERQAGHLTHPSRQIGPRNKDQTVHANTLVTLTVIVVFVTTPSFLCLKHRSGMIECQWAQVGGLIGFADLRRRINGRCRTLFFGRTPVRYSNHCLVLRGADGTKRSSEVRNGTGSPEGQAGTVKPR